MGLPPPLFFVCSFVGFRRLISHTALVTDGSARRTHRPGHAELGRAVLLARSGGRPPAGFLDKAIYRGQRMMNLCHNAQQVLVTWTQLLPNARGVDQKQLLRDVKALHRVRKANDLPAGSLGGGARACLLYTSDAADE